MVSLSPATTEAVAAVGAERELVGRSRYCDYPPSVSAVPVVGGYTDPNLEAIVALGPTLVVGVEGPPAVKMTEALEPRGISVYLPSVESVAAVSMMLREVGVRSGHAEGGEKAARALQEDIARVEKEFAGTHSERVLLLYGVNPLVAAGKGSFGDEMLVLAHAKNVITAGGAYPSIDAERVLVMDPDVIINAAFGESATAAVLDPKTSLGARVRAVKTGRVVNVTDERVLRPGPRLAEGLRVLAESIHGPRK